jgi:hypothetical protein
MDVGMSGRADMRLASELAAARVVLAQLSTPDLMRVILASPPAGKWSRLLVSLLRGELQSREFGTIGVLGGSGPP